ncbi:hypothetical protein BpHYR1_046773 [Brachionus plicatilis]|uniref:Secreted protein n=1 Tax=Brachionus plicatilis TaxID=10195 RepID=A0A3M7Q0N3_BRAPC|nr:hypothetical protein BpHYR1_046773 [Brachionus plicatilis]
MKIVNVVSHCALLLHQLNLTTFVSLMVSDANSHFLTSAQHCFVPSKSCATNLKEVIKHFSKLFAENFKNNDNK